MTQPAGQTTGRILVVDDSDIIRALLRRSLSLGAYEAVEAEDGAEALALLNRDSQFDLIICDLTMPRMDGLTLIRLLRASDTLADIPILVLTGEDLDPKAPPPTGADALLVKPFRPSELLHLIRTMLAKRQLTTLPPA